MAAGITVYREDVDNKWGGLALQCNQLMSAITQAKVWMDLQTATTLAALPFKTSAYANPGDTNIVKGTATDLANLASYLTAGATAKTGTVVANDGTHFGYDFRFWAGQMYGLGG
jgi:hypothetical protein